MSILQALFLSYLFAIVAVYVAREEPELFLIGPWDDGLSFAEREQLRMLRQAAVVAKRDRYEGRHRRLISEAEYRARLSEIGAEDRPDWLKPLYKPWRPDWR